MEHLRAGRVAVFIDGFNLYHGLKEESGRKHLWLDLEALSRSLLKPRQTLVSATYFTAMVRDDPDALQRQDLYLQALEARSSRLQIVRGKFQRRRVVCHACGRARISYEEKETDVSLAVALLEGAAKRASDTAILLSGDGDFVPAVKAARRVDPSLRVIGVFPPRRVSDALRSATDASFVLGRRRIDQNQLPALVDGPRGPIARPSHWE